MRSLKPEAVEEPAAGGTPERGLPPEHTPLTLFTMEEAAAHLRVSRRWLQDFIKAHPFYRLAGRRKVFTAADITALFEAFPRPENYRPPCGRSAAVRGGTLG